MQAGENMKRILITLLMLMGLCAGSAFAREYDFPGTLHVGLAAEYQPVFGDFKDYITGSMGAGLSVEFDLPSDSFSRLGISAHGSYNINPVSNEKLEQMTSAKASLGIYGRIALGSLRFYFVPELNAGVIAYFPEAKSNYSGQLEKMYLDTCVQAGLGFRIVPGWMNFRLEFEVTPLYTFAMEQSEFTHYAGGRVGVLFKF